MKNKNYRFIPKRIFFVFLSCIFLASCATILKTNFMESVDLLQLRDGVYIGEDANLLCSVKLTVKIESNKIKEIKVLDKFFTWPAAADAYKKIPARIIEEQSIDVDAITAATVSSNNIKKAVLSALNKSKNP